jgi:hypothetical protein
VRNAAFCIDLDRRTGYIQVVRNGVLKDIFLGLQQLHLGPTPESDAMPLRRKAEGKGWSPVDLDWAPKKPSVRPNTGSRTLRGPVVFHGVSQER